MSWYDTAIDGAYTRDKPSSAPAFHSDNEPLKSFLDQVYSLLMVFRT
jgi:hypothetical protein